MKEIASIQDKKQAAYALNLCTVSVSQIVDYNDINILEQEYEAILNNLNLEHMPHDEALLHVLKQLLDTITFFRMQEGDRRIADLKYRQKMKNAIWNAVPNFGLIVAGGNPVTIAISLASQIGIGYMNYRKEKANNELEKAEQEWQLQRAAIEQFNGLQRELFDTAWRLADAYGFEDAWRLSEKQIKQYDEILMDSNSIRRYERLLSIKDNFNAYPPFWYYLGNTANEISRDESARISDESKALFRKEALEYFDKYWEVNSFPLLREDMLAASCALEYADLLIEDGNDTKKIIELIHKAAKYAGNELDVLQLCSIAYLRIGANEEATELLRILVNEDYNVSLNSQLLSGVYVSCFIKTKKAEVKANYELLTERVSNLAYLIPWPEQGKDTDAEFLNNQRQMLLGRYSQMLTAYNKQLTIKLNKILPAPDPFAYEQKDDYWYSDANSKERLKEMKTVFDYPEKRDRYLNAILELDYIGEYVKIINEFCENLDGIRAVRDIESIVKVFTETLHKYTEAINAAQERIRNNCFNFSDYEIIQRCNSEKSREAVFNELIKQVDAYCNEVSDMGESSLANGEIAEFCNKNGLSQPDSKESRLDAIESMSAHRTYIGIELFGEEAESTSNKLSRFPAMLDVIKNKLNPELEKSTNLLLLVKGQKQFEEYFENRKRSYLKQYKPDILAIIDDTSFFTDIDIVLMTTGVIYVVRDIPVSIESYDGIKKDITGKEMIIGTKKYGNKTEGVVETIYAVMKELGSISKEEQ